MSACISVAEDQTFVMNRGFGSANDQKHLDW